jgi:hypothetical protein
MMIDQAKLLATASAAPPTASARPAQSKGMYSKTHSAVSAASPSPAAPCRKLDSSACSSPVPPPPLPRADFRDSTSEGRGPGLDWW